MPRVYDWKKHPMLGSLKCASAQVSPAYGRIDLSFVVSEVWLACELSTHNYVQPLVPLQGMHKAVGTLRS